MAETHFFSDIEMTTVGIHVVTLPTAIPLTSE